jgi:hypothetical protein
MRIHGQKLRHLQRVRSHTVAQHLFILKMMPSCEDPGSGRERPRLVEPGQPTLILGKTTSPKRIPTWKNRRHQPTWSRSYELSRTLIL